MELSILKASRCSNEGDWNNPNGENELTDVPIGVLEQSGGEKRQPDVQPRNMRTIIRVQI